MLDPSLSKEYNKTRKVANRDLFCHAPFTSINFEQNGHATVCCYNRSYVLGKWPQQSLDEIWMGEQAQNIRREMVRGRALPAGCEICAEQFSSRNFGGLKARIYDRYAEKRYPVQKGRFVQMPKVMEFELSNVCNLECSMCNGYFSSTIRKNREALPALQSPYTSAFVEQLRPYIPTLQEAKFLGGEPFLIDIYYEIWELIAEVKPELEIHITTNGTILNQRVKDLLERMNVSIIVSIDSLKKDTYEGIRKHAKFDRVREHLDWFAAYVKRKKNMLNLAVCPIRDNWRDLPGILQYCNKVGANVYFNTVLHPESLAIRSMSYPELQEVRDFMERQKIKRDSDQQNHNARMWDSLLNQVKAWEEDSRSQYEDERRSIEKNEAKKASIHSQERGLSQGALATFRRYLEDFPELESLTGKSQNPGAADSFEVLDALLAFVSLLDKEGLYSTGPEFVEKVDVLRRLCAEAGAVVEVSQALQGVKGLELIKSIDQQALAGIEHNFRQYFGL